MAKYLWPLLILTLILSPLAFVFPEHKSENLVGGITVTHSGRNKIRFVALKHSKEYIAEMDADLSIGAVNRAAAKGLPIECVGNHYINKDGKRQVAFTDFNYDLPKLKLFISEMMKINAEPGDTMVVYTVGHGGRAGQLDNLGQRSGVMKAIAEAAEENDQRTLWWQLSCHAAANLPPITTLTPKQQDLMSILCSSAPNELSSAGEQYRILEKMFYAMADRSKEIDPDEDETITGAELRNFLNKAVGKKRGDLLFMKSLDDPIFGGRTLANQIPIIDRNGPQGKYSRDYIPIPLEKKEKLD